MTRKQRSKELEFRRILLNTSATFYVATSVSMECVRTQGIHLLSIKMAVGGRVAMVVVVMVKRFRELLSDEFRSLNERFVCTVNRETHTDTRTRGRFHSHRSFPTSHPRSRRFSKKNFLFRTRSATWILTYHRLFPSHWPPFFFLLFSPSTLSS